MTAHHDLDRQLKDFLRDGPDELPYESFDAVRDRTEQTRQRVVIGPWRLPEMNKIVTVGLGAAAVVVLVFVGAQLFGSPGGGFGGGPTPSATAEPTPDPTATPPESESATASAPPLTETFTSTQHGITLSYPDGWVAQAATEPWTAATFPLDVNRSDIDVLQDPVLTSSLFLTVASQPLGDATPEEWISLQMTSGEGCGTATEPVTVDGATGEIGAEECHIAVVTTNGRGYWIQLYTSGDNSSEMAAYDRAWFEQVLAGVQLQPEDAVDSTSSPAP